MRFTIIAALSALATLAMASIVCAKDDQGASGPTKQTPTVSDNAHGGPTVEQEKAIPYRPCMEARGWVNGHLRCHN
jgi:hypothetical protein